MKRVIRMEPREADLDGMLHTIGGNCCIGWPACPRCGAREHAQGVYGGVVRLCEAGTHRADGDVIVYGHPGDCTCGVCACSMCGGNAMSCGEQCSVSRTTGDE